MIKLLYFQLSEHKCSQANIQLDFILLFWHTKTQSIWRALRCSCDLAVCWCTWCAARLCSYTWIVVLVGLAAPVPWRARPWLTCITFLLTECLKLHRVIHCLSAVGATSTTREAECCIWTDLVVLTWTKLCNRDHIFITYNKNREMLKVGS
jgi:hypothetical protein